MHRNGEPLSRCAATKLYLLISLRVGRARTNYIDSQAAPEQDAIGRQRNYDDDVNVFLCLVSLVLLRLADADVVAYFLGLDGRSTVVRRDSQP